MSIFKTVDKRENTNLATADDGWSKIIALQPEAQNYNWFSCLAQSSSLFMSSEVPLEAAM